MAKEKTELNVPEAVVSLYRLLLNNPVTDPVIIAFLDEHDSDPEFQRYASMLIFLHGGYREFRAEEETPVSEE